MSNDGTNRRKNEQERKCTNKVRGFGGVVKLGHVCTLLFHQTNQPVLLPRLPGYMCTNCPIQWRGSSFKNSLSGENLASESIICYDCFTNVEQRRVPTNVGRMPPFECGILSQRARRPFYCDHRFPSRPLGCARLYRSCFLFPDVSAATDCALLEVSWKGASCAHWSPSCRPVHRDGSFPTWSSNLPIEDG